MEATWHRRLFTVDEYMRMAEVGILSERDRVELISGEIVQMSPIGPDHSGSSMRLNQLLTLRLVTRALVSVQNPLKLDMRSLPEPDVCVLRPRSDFYRGGYAGPEDTFLVIEVANTSLAWDRRVKSSLYAEHGIQDYWILNLRNSCVEVFRKPTKMGYEEKSIHRVPDVLIPLAFPDMELSVEELLG